MNAQTTIDVEVEVAGPWSYVQDSSDPSRVIVVAPHAGHILSVFSGGDIYSYNGTQPQAVSTIHNLNFTTAPCGTKIASSVFLYPANGVDTTTIKTALSPSADTYAISLPKPCYYETATESRFKYNGLRPVTNNDVERSFTTSMTLHYKTTDKSSIVFDNASSIKFDNSATPNPAVSVVMYLDSGIDIKCDAHSRHVFYLTESLWALPHVYRVFPQLKIVGNSNQQSNGYDLSCAQQTDPAPPMEPETMASIPKTKTPSFVRHTLTSSKRHMLSPGRADCHAAQVNVNGVVN